MAVGYGVAAWFCLQLYDMIRGALGLPEETDLTALMFALAGLPVAIALGWIYDVTPQGLKATLALSDDTKLAAPADGPASQAPAAVVVLPFEKLTPVAEHAYIADALPIELQSMLSRVNGLRVVSRQSAVARSGGDSDLRTVARHLNVQYVISGSVAEIGGRLQINVQLDDAIDDTLLWSERYDVAANDLATVQREISEKVVGTFGGERLRSEIRRANEAAVSDTNAWQLVQKARAYLLDYTPNSIAAAIPLLRRAIELDPKYAVAYATLGLVTAEKTLNGISADPTADRRYAMEVISRAEQLAPRDPVVLRATGCVHAYVGAYGHSLEILRRAVKLAPYDLGTWGYLGWPLVSTGRPEDLDEAHQILDRLLSTSPQHPGRAYWLFHKSVAYVCADDCVRALAHAEEFTADQPKFSLGWLHYVNVLGRLGRSADARAALDRSLQSNPMMTPAYYAGLMAILTDQPAVIERRTSGLHAAGLI